MDDSQSFLVRHGYISLFSLILVDQIGLPVPGVAFLLGAGALIATGRMNFALAVGMATLGSLLANWLWYELGRRRGPPVLRFLCRLALEPDACVRRTETVFERHGAKALLVAKFIPGVDLMAPPIAGMTGMTLRRFLALAAVGAAAWAAAFMTLGYLFHGQIEELVAFLARLGAPLGLAVAVLIVGYAGWKYLARRRFMKRLRIARVHPDDLMRRLDAAEELFIVDLRQNLDFAADPRILPGAHRIAVEDLEQRHVEIPRDRDIILYCT